MNAMPVNQPLVQIRRGYAAEWKDFALSVEWGKQGWSASVEDRADRHRLHTAHRSSPGAAKLAALEFALFQVPAARGEQPERLLRDLNWKEYW